MKNMERRIDYENWNSLWRSESYSSCFCADGEKDFGDRELALSERLLFTQSNARVLLGQDARGHLSFVCAPQEKDYPLPTGVTKEGIPITACPGMYDQTDVAMWYGDVHYAFELDGKPVAPVDETQSKTWYLEHYLPVTYMKNDILEARVLSFAPVLEAKARSSGIPGTPLPGPSGAFYVAVIRNCSDRRVRGKCRLKFERRFVVRSEYNGRDPFERDCLEPYHCEWEGGIFVMWRPDASAAITLQGGIRGEVGSDWFAPFSLDPGEEKAIVCRIAVSPTKQGLSEAISVLLRHDPLEWLSETSSFWKERLGRLTLRLDAPDELAERYAGFQIRNFFDNFNCLQTDGRGRLLVHWQGAPSHNIGRFWGIDIEPTVNSLLYILPELGPVAIRYIAERNEPAFSPFSDHSTPIRAALLIIAGKYLELTGDVQFFRSSPQVMQAMRNTFQRILDSKHGKYALFSSRYSSDGIVFHRYDVGTNVKVWVALGAYQRILDALGEPCPVDVEALRKNLQADLLRELVADGPFGPQFTGGKTFGESREFYFRDDIFYYDGEDSTSCLMPVYGFCEFTEPAWQNYHRFARSVFCSNYDPEMYSLRWFFYGGAVDGTAYVSALGGSVTRNEMRDSLENLAQCDLDVTGSLFWWPKGINRRRCIARCSQGQGSWAIQGMEQWLGLHYDALNRVLTVCPRGLVTAYRWEGARMGAGLFDIDWSEAENGARLALRNRCVDSIRVRVGVRESGSGCDGTISWYDLEVAAGETAECRWPQPHMISAPGVNIVSKEIEWLGKDGEIFDFAGLQCPSAEQAANAFLIRCIWIPREDCEMASVRVEVAEGWGIVLKPLRYWPELRNVSARSATAEWHEAKAGERIVAPFFVQMPAAVDASNVWQGTHPFAYPPMHGERALFAASEIEGEAHISATLSYRDRAGNHEIQRKLPVHLMLAKDHARVVRQIMHGECEGSEM